MTPQFIGTSICKVFNNIKTQILKSWITLKIRTIYIYIKKAMCSREYTKMSSSKWNFQHLCWKWHKFDINFFIRQTCLNTQIFNRTSTEFRVNLPSVALFEQHPHLKRHHILTGHKDWRMSHLLVMNVLIPGNDKNYSLLLFSGRP